MAKIKVNELTQQTPQLNDTLLASGENNEYACKIDDLKNLITPSVEALNNIKDAENGGIIEGLVEGEAGQVNIASGLNAHVEGGKTFSNPVTGETEYVINQATGECSHAEGIRTTASGQGSHAEGASTTASGQFSHAEGNGTTASGPFSHAEGNFTMASGDNSHVEGDETIANHKSQHVFGEYNVEDPSTAGVESRGTYVEIVGNGNDSNRSNARTLDWNGNEVLAGKLTVGVQPTEDNDVATKKYVDENSGGLNNIKDAENGGVIEGLVQVNTASGQYAHAEGKFTTASGATSHAEGNGTNAIGQYSHAEGDSANANEYASHAEGIRTSALGYCSHAEGANSNAMGGYSHAEGDTTVASGEASHAEGCSTVANHAYQHVFGEYNIADPSTAQKNARGNYVEIVGNGVGAKSKSNARTLDWSGNEWLAGSISPDGGVILKSPNGTAFKLTVSDDGTLSATNANA